MGRCRDHRSTGALVVFLAGMVLSVTALASPATAASHRNSSTTTNSVPAATTTTVPGSPATGNLPVVPVEPTTLTAGIDGQVLLHQALTLTGAGTQDLPLSAELAASAAQRDIDSIHAAAAQAGAQTASDRAAQASAVASAAAADYQSLEGVLRAAVLRLYLNGPAERPPDNQATDPNNIGLAQMYTSLIVTPDGILAKRRADLAVEHKAELTGRQEVLAANSALDGARAALAAGQKETASIQGLVASLDATNAVAVTAEQSALSDQAGRLLLDTALVATNPPPAPVATTSAALTWAFSELGKPYTWGATGPDTFDCSGLTQYVWAQAGVHIPRVAVDQDTWTDPVGLAQLLPGDLVFFGTTDIHHVGIYIGAGLMINAPHTGDVVRVSSIWWSDLAGFGRVHTAGVAGPAHSTPSAQHPAPPAVIPAAGAAPSQTAPPTGWAPVPGGSAPLPGYYADPTTPGSPVDPVTTGTSPTGPGDTASTLPPDTAPPTSTSSSSSTTEPPSTTTVPATTAVPPTS